jgi:hypothetical protein
MWNRLGPARLVIALCALLTSAGEASAGSLTWDFSYDLLTGVGDEVTASGTLTTSDVEQYDAVGNYYYYTILDIAGTRTDATSTASIASLFAVGGFLGNDNRLIPTGPYLTYNGLSYVLDDANHSRVNLYYYPGDAAYHELVYLPNGVQASSPASGTSVHVTLQGVPEPASIALVGAAGLVVAALARRRRPEAAN